MKKRLAKYIVLFLVLITGCSADLHTKRLALKNIPHYESLTIVDGFMELSYTENKGMVFGVWNNQESILKYLVVIGMTFISIMFIGYIIWRVRHLSFLYLLPLALILAGAFGNLFDRVRFGHVIDFIHIYWKDYFNWPFLFNLADVLICFGEFLLIILIITKKKDVLGCFMQRSIPESKSDVKM